MNCVSIVSFALRTAQKMIQHKMKVNYSKTGKHKTNGMNIIMCRQATINQFIDEAGSWFLCRKEDDTNLAKLYNNGCTFDVIWDNLVVRACPLELNPFNWFCGNEMNDDNPTDGFSSTKWNFVNFLSPMSVHLISLNFDATSMLNVDKIKMEPPSLLDN